MAQLHPFRALRPPPARAAEVASVPYDVVDTAEARALAQGRPHSFLHVVRPEIDLPDDVDVHDGTVYELGRMNLEKFIREVPLLEDPAPSLYVYRLRMGERSQTGVVGCCAIDEYDDDRIRKHERTRPDKEDDRTRHVVEMRCQAEPIFLACRDQADVDAQIAAAVRADPLYDFTADDGVQHTIWRVTDVQAMRAAFQRVPLLYVADGHHRAASASRARAHFRARNPRHDGSEEYNRVLATVFPAGQLRILPYNRVVKDLGGRSARELLDGLRSRFPLTASEAGTPSRRGEFRVCVAGERGPEWHSFRIEARPGASTIAALDVSLLQDEVLAPLLGIGDPRTDARIDFVGGIRGAAELEKRVRDGRAAAAFSLHPTSMQELMAVSDAGEIMPPKSTWFEPKLRSGLFLHRI